MKSNNEKEHPGIAERAEIRAGLLGYERWRRSAGGPAEESLWMRRICRDLESRGLQIRRRTPTATHPNEGAA